MIIKNYKYDNSEDGIHYTVDVERNRVTGETKQ